MLNHTQSNTNLIYVSHYVLVTVFYYRCIVTPAESILYSLRRCGGKMQMGSNSKPKQTEGCVLECVWSLCSPCVCVQVSVSWLDWEEAKSSKYLTTHGTDCFSMHIVLMQEHPFSVFTSLWGAPNLNLSLGRCVLSSPPPVLVEYLSR